MSPPTPAEAYAPPAALTGPQAAAPATPAGLTAAHGEPRSTAEPAVARHAGTAMPLAQLLLLVTLGVVACGLVLVVTPYARHRRRTR